MIEIPKNTCALYLAEHRVYDDCVTYVSTSGYESLNLLAKISVSPLLARQLIVTLTCIFKLKHN
jgi:hypothetical protein